MRQYIQELRKNLKNIKLMDTLYPKMTTILLNIQKLTD